MTSQNAKDLQAVLKPCPFCGGSDLESGGDDKFVGVRCNLCEASGPNHYITGRDWNTRAESALAEQSDNQNFIAALRYDAEELRKMKNPPHIDFLKHYTATKLEHAADIIEKSALAEQNKSPQDPPITSGLAQRMENCNKDFGKSSPASGCAPSQPEQTGSPAAGTVAQDGGDLPLSEATLKNHLYILDNSLLRGQSLAAIRLKAENERLRAVLAWYGNKDIYEYQPDKNVAVLSWFGGMPPLPPEIDGDRGTKARAALEEG